MMEEVADSTCLTAARDCAGDRCGTGHSSTASHGRLSRPVAGDVKSHLPKCDRRDNQRLWAAGRRLCRGWWKPCDGTLCNSAAGGQRGQIGYGATRLWGCLAAARSKCHRRRCLRSDGTICSHRGSLQRAYGPARSVRPGQPILPVVVPSQHSKGGDPLDPVAVAAVVNRPMSAFDSALPACIFASRIRGRYRAARAARRHPDSFDCRRAAGGIGSNAAGIGWAACTARQHPERGRPDSHVKQQSPCAAVADRPVAG